MNYPLNTRSLSGRVHLSARPARQQHENRGHGSLDENPTELANGGVSGDDDGTYVTASTSQTYQATWMDLLPAIKTTATAMAARGFGSTV